VRSKSINFKKIFIALAPALLNGFDTSVWSAILINCIMNVYDHHLYGIFANQKARCFNKNSQNYHNYGGRGIVISDEFKDNFLLWYKYVMSLPNAAKKLHSIDRINNEKGYERGNMRWATYYQQARNKRKYACNKSGYVGVKHTHSNKWSSSIVVDYKCKGLGTFDTKEQAISARNEYIITNGLMDYNIQTVKS
jgi:hypothetical protein